MDKQEIIDLMDKKRGEALRIRKRYRKELQLRKARPFDYTERPWDHKYWVAQTTLAAQLEKEADELEKSLGEEA